MIKIAFYGESGCGKSTIAGEVKKYYDLHGKKVDIIKLAYPLYCIQNVIYEYAGKKREFYDQNQDILETAAKYLREINPNSLIENFEQRFNESSADVVINDDIRETTVDYPYLKKMGFVFIRIVCNEEVRCARLVKRNDLCSIKKSKTTEHIDNIIPDYIIDTTSSDITNSCEQLVKYLNKLSKVL